MWQCRINMRDGHIPVSRFWACFFASSIFALLWTQKMKKTRRWIVIMFAPTTIMIVVPAIVVSYMTGMDMFATPEDMWDTNALFTIFGFLIYIPVGIAVPIYFMFKWATEYNLLNFGYKSKYEWEQANDTNES